MTYPKRTYPKNKAPKRTEERQFPEETEWKIVDPIVRDIVRNDYQDVSAERLSILMKYCKKYCSLEHFDVSIYKNMERLCEEFVQKNRKEVEDDEEDEMEIIPILPSTIGRITAETAKFLMNLCVIVVMLVMMSLALKAIF